MRTGYLYPPILLIITSACSNTPPCEDILEVKQQAKLCQQLQSTMSSSKNPTQVLLARSRFEKECENLRYYRDDYDTICTGGQKPIGQQNSNNDKTLKKEIE